MNYSDFLVNCVETENEKKDPGMLNCFTIYTLDSSSTCKQHFSSIRTFDTFRYIGMWRPHGTHRSCLWLPLAVLTCPISAGRPVEVEGRLGCNVSMWSDVTNGAFCSWGTTWNSSYFRVDKWKHFLQGRFDFKLKSHVLLQELEHTLRL
jgi:hypothetical protein